MTNEKKNTITVEIRNSYGTDHVYPICEIGKMLVRLTQKVCFNERDVDIIKKLGFDIKVKQKTL